MSLERFYAEIAPLLFGEAEVEAVEQRLGPSSSGSENLDFYRVLIARNINKILRELFSAVHTVVTREHPGLWPELVRDYGRTHPCAARDPNRYGLEFSDYLAARRAARGEYSPLLEELADLHMCRYLAAIAPDSPDAAGDDGFDERVFVRGYTYPVAQIVEALARDREAELAEPRAATVIIYRSLLEPNPVRVHGPTAPQLAALVRRQGLALPGALARLSTNEIDAGLAQLVAAGVLH